MEEKTEKIQQLFATRPALSKDTCASTYFILSRIGLKLFAWLN